MSWVRRIEVLCRIVARVPRLWRRAEDRTELLRSNSVLVSSTRTQLDYKFATADGL